MMHKLWFYLSILWKPRWWFMNYPYCAEWDREFRALLFEHDFENVTGSRVDLGPEKNIWWGVYPVSSFKKNGCRPSRYTIYCAWHKLHNDVRIVYGPDGPGLP